MGIALPLMFIMVVVMGGLAFLALLAIERTYDTGAYAKKAEESAVDSSIAKKVVWIQGKINPFFEPHQRFHLGGVLNDSLFKREMIQPSTFPDYVLLEDHSGDLALLHLNQARVEDKNKFFKIVTSDHLYNSLSEALTWDVEPKDQAFAIGVPQPAEKFFDPDNKGTLEKLIRDVNYVLRTCDTGHTLRNQITAATIPNWLEDIIREQVEGEEHQGLIIGLFSRCKVTFKAYPQKPLILSTTPPTKFSTFLSERIFNYCSLIAGIIVVGGAIPWGLFFKGP